MNVTRKIAAVVATSAIVFLAMFITSVAQQVPPVPSAQTPVAAILQSYAPVTAERLKNPEPANWLSIRRTYDGWGYSPLNQITTGNVEKLKPVWGILTGEARVHDAQVRGLAGGLEEPVDGQGGALGEVGGPGVGELLGGGGRLHPAGAQVPRRFPGEDAAAALQLAPAVDDLAARAGRHRGAAARDTKARGRTLPAASPGAPPRSARGASARPRAVRRG